MRSLFFARVSESEVGGGGTGGRRSFSLVNVAVGVGVVVDVFLDEFHFSPRRLSRGYHRFCLQQALQPRRASIFP